MRPSTCLTYGRRVADGILSGPIDLDRGAGRPRVASPTVPATPGLALTERSSSAQLVVVAFVAGTVTVRDAFGETTQLRGPPGPRFAVDGRAVTLGPAAAAPAAAPVARRAGRSPLPPRPGWPGPAASSSRASTTPSWLRAGVGRRPAPRGHRRRAARRHGPPRRRDPARSGPAPGRRLGVLLDHLVDGTKEARAAAATFRPRAWSPATPTSTCGRR